MYQHGPIKAAARALCASVLAVGVAAPASANGGHDRGGHHQGGPGDDGGRFNVKPGFVRGEVHRTAYDGIDDDLLTAGLGASGLTGAAPSLSAPPTAAELRRLAIYNNYRALLDMTGGGGYGTLYGPNVLADGTVTAGEGLVPGVEYLAYASRGRGRDNVTMLVQIPDAFDPAHACLVTGPSSGSRGVYGAIATSGEWGLKNGCAIAYTDKGGGTGAHSMSADTVNLITGERIGADEAGKASAFTAPISDAKREAFDAARPDRFAFKHAHSRRNPESRWGDDVLDAIEFAFWALNEEFGEPSGRHDKIRRTVTPENTIVIASSVSNGGGASLLAVERDRRGLIDGAAVSEPNVNPRFDPSFVIAQAGREPVAEHSRSLYDYTSLLNVYQSCANAANPTAPLNLTDFLGVSVLGENLGANRCASLAETGLLSAPDPQEAQDRINAAGILVEQNVVQPSHWWVSLSPAITVTYANAYAKARVEDALCGFTFAATDGNATLTVPGTGAPVPLAEAAEAALFGTGNGIPPTGGINVVYDDAHGGPVLDRYGVSPSTGRSDESFDGALCLRALHEGRDPATGEKLRGRERAAHRQLVKGVRDIRASGDLRGLPAVIVTGRADAILPPNHHSRGYFGLNQLVEEGDSGLRYYEVTNAQHLDAFNAFSGFDSRFVPLHHYFVQGLDLIYALLRGERDALPPSQVVETTPRGVDSSGSVPPIDAAVNLPAIAEAPSTPIVFTGTELLIP